MESEQISKILPDSKKEGFSDTQRLLLEKRLRGFSTKKREENSIPRRPVGCKVPLSAEQRRIWLHTSQQPETPVYNEPITIVKYGPCSVELLKASLNEIVRRHEAWRTSFTAEGEALVHGSLQVELPFSDLSAMPEEEREAEALRLATEDAQRLFSLDCAPLFRARAVRMSPNEHRIYLTLHHIIFDGVSLSRVLLPEMSTIYEAFEQGKELTLPAPLLQYGDYAVWRTRQLESADASKHLQYWVRQLSGELPILRLPSDRPRLSVSRHRGSMERFDISAKLLADLRNLSRSQGVTLYTVLLTAFETLLFRYSGQEDLIIGSATDARRRPELEHLMGYFLDTVAIRTRPKAQTRFVEYLAETQDKVLEGIAAADVPFDRIVSEVNPKRDISHHPIFQAFFSMRPAMAAMPEGWSLAHLDVTVDASKFDLYLELGEHGNEVEGRFLYSTDLFDTVTIKRMTQHLLTLLESVCDDPEAMLGSVPILTQSERALLIGEDGWNHTSRDLPKAPVQVLIELQAERTPNAIAVKCGSDRFTYKRLSERSDELAKRLRNSGVTRGSVVGIALDRSFDLLAGMIGVLKCGAAYLPLDIVMPRERIAICLADAAPAAVLTQRSLLQHVTPSEFVNVLVDDDVNLIVEETSWSDESQEQDTLDDTAYVIYTSGTTGAPKAVEISQRSLLNLLVSMQAEPGFAQKDVLLALTAVSFDIAALELFLPLVSGGTVVIATREEIQDPHLLIAAMKRSLCSVVQATPSTWRTLLRAGWKHAGAADAGRQLQLRLLCGGEALTVELADELVATGAEVWNMYGPTETTIWSMIHPVSPEPLGRTYSIPVGHPIANTQAYILDAQQQLLPVGVRGELFLGGLGLAKGYRGKPQQTSERFLTVDAVEGARLYRTGDLALRRRDGTIEVSGRTDNQVKIRGYRVELEAVEASVLLHPQVSAAAARAWPEPTGDMRLVVYIVPKGEKSPSLAEIRAFLSSHSPEYMIPSSIVLLEQMPLTTNGKADRSRLPPPAVTKDVNVQEVDSSPEEKSLRAIWFSLLGVEQIGLDDDFFSLGGHSVLVAALQQKLNAETGHKVPMSELFHQPTMRQQLKMLESKGVQSRPLPPGVFVLQDGGEQEPTFWVHYANDSLAKAMGRSQPFYSVVLTTEDLISLGAKPSLETIAMFHLQKILATQPTGPYRLGGFCVGGVVAYEIARLLRRANYKVSTLVLVDTPNPSPFKIKKVFRYCKWIVGTGGSRAISQWFHKRLDDRFKRETVKAPPTEMRKAQEVLEDAASRYRPGRYEGDVLLIQASDRLHMDLFPAWKDVIKDGLKTKYVDGHHDDLMKAQNVGDVGEAILSHLVGEL